MRIRLFYASLAMVILGGCATTQQAPPESEISVDLSGTAVEVQTFIESKLRGNPQTAPLKVDSATDRSIVFKAPCMSTPNMGAFKCSLIMMAVGNSGWDGPYSVMTFRTSEVRGVVHLTLSTEWCATNAFGKTNCMPDGSNSQRNQLLRAVKAGYEEEANLQAESGAPI